MCPVEALFAPTDSVAQRWALFLHLHVPIAKVVTVETPGQVVPQLGIVVFPARLALGGFGGGAVRRHVSAWWTLVAEEGFPSEMVCMLILGNDFHRRGTTEDIREQDQSR